MSHGGDCFYDLGVGGEEGRDFSDVNIYGETDRSEEAKRKDLAPVLGQFGELGVLLADFVSDLGAHCYLESCRDH